MKKWRCKVCNFVHTGNEPPEECPVCKAEKSQFILMEESSTSNQSQKSARWRCTVCGYIHEGGWMTNMFTVYLKEIKSYYSSPVACIFSGLFLLVSAILFCINNLFMESSNFNNTLASMGVVLIFIIPVLTMRILSEERKNGTEALLLTSPISLASIVVGKYLAALTVFLIFTIISFIFPLSLLAFGGKITAQLLGGYAGFIFLGAAYISIGVFASSLTKNQIISACLSFVILLIIWISSSFANVVGGGVSRILKWLSLISRYESFNLGLFKIEHLVYYLSFIILFITLTVMVIEKRRWS